MLDTQINRRDITAGVGFLALLSVATLGEWFDGEYGEFSAGVLSTIDESGEVFYNAYVGSKRMLPTNDTQELIDFMTDMICAEYRRLGYTINGG